MGCRNPGGEGRGGRPADRSGSPGEYAPSDLRRRIGADTCARRHVVTGSTSSADDARDASTTVTLRSPTRSSGQGLQNQTKFGLRSSGGTSVTPGDRRVSYHPGECRASRVIDRGGRQVWPGEAGIFGVQPQRRRRRRRRGIAFLEGGEVVGWEQPPIGRVEMPVAGACVRRPCRRGLPRGPPRWRRPASTVAGGGVARRRGSPTRVSVGRIR